MKKYFYFLAAVAALSLASCNKNEPTGPVEPEGPDGPQGPQAVEITVRGRVAETRTHIVAAQSGDDWTYTSHWDDAGEALGAFLFQSALTASDTPARLPGENSGDEMVFHGTGMPLEDGTYRLFLYSPYSAYVSTGDGFIVGNLKTSQSPVQGSFDPACDLMGYSTDNVVVSDGAAVIENITLQRPMAILRVNLTADAAGIAAGEVVTSIKMENALIPLTGTVKIGMTGNAEFTDPKTYVEATIPASEAITIGGANGTNAVYFIVAPVTIPQNTEITFTVETADHSGENAIVRTVTAPSAMAFQGGKVNVIDLKIRDKDAGEMRYAGGTGIESDPWLIATAQHMIHMTEDGVDGETKYFKMIDDVDMSSVAAADWTPYNNEGEYAKKIYFDGDNHLVSNLALESRDGVKYMSVFGLVNGTVKNVKFKNCSVTSSSSDPLGLVAGWAGNLSGTITAALENVHATQCALSCSYAKNDIGGLVGRTNATTYKKCSYDGTITRTAKADDDKYYHMGGVIGNCYASEGSLTIENCSSSGTLTDPDNSVGGILGGMNGEFYVEVTNCSSTVDIISEGKVIGGIIGYTGMATVSGCTYDGNITTTYSKDSYVGGIVPYNYHWTIISNCTSAGKITATKGRVGGIYGSIGAQNGDTHEVFVITNCSSSMTINVSNGDNCGGIVGYGYYTYGGRRSITGCSFTGTLNTKGQQCGGIIGYAHWTDITKCSVSGTVNSTGGSTGIGGIAGRANHDVLIEDCSFTGSFTCNNQRSAGIVGNTSGSNLVIRRCFVGSSLLDKNLNIAGILGNGQSANSTAGTHENNNITIEKCIVWSPTITAQSGTAAQWGSGAIAGSIGGKNTLTDNFRNPDMVLTYTCANTEWPLLYDQENASASAQMTYYNGAVEAPATCQSPYHGKAAAAGKSAAQVASDLSYPADTWDLTGSAPVLK